MGFFNYLMKNLSYGDTKSNLAKEKIYLDKNLIQNNKKDSVAIVTPKTFQDIVDLVNYISNGHTAVVDFNQISGNTIERGVDFLSGAIFALGGEMKNISQGLYLYAPNGVKLINPNKRKNV